MRYAFLLFLLLTALPFSTGRAEDFVVLDSMYFTMDDGIQSPEEMAAEAEFVHGLCTQNSYQSLYFDCDCMAGAFLQIRESVGPMTPQNDILTRLTKSRNAQCANEVAIAGQSYQDCLEFASISRELEPDNEEFCTCAGNKTAKDFAKEPNLNIDHIRSVKKSALAFCAAPANRARYLGNTKTAN